MSLYRKASIFTLWILLVFVTLPLWAFGLSGWKGFAAGAFLLGHGFAMMFFFRCPSCNHSIFTGRLFGMTVRKPWPRRECGWCGIDLAEP
jgi:hypothetical protein